MTKAELKRLIAKGEASNVDFKISCNAFISSSKVSNAELIRDICAMSNNHKIVSYIVIGVSDSGKDFKSVINHELTDINLQDLCAKHISPPPKIKLIKLKWSDSSGCSDIIIIQIGPHSKYAYHLALDNINYPIGLCHRKHEVWIRRGTTNALASPSEIVQLEAGISEGDKIDLENPIESHRRSNIAKSNNKYFHTLVAAGMQYAKTSRYDLVIECLKEALKYKPDEIGLHLALSGIYGEKIKPTNQKKAIAHCRKVIRIDKKNVSGWFNLAVYTNHLNGAQKSLPIYLEAEKLIINQGLQDAEIGGKLNIFIGHDLRDTGKRQEAEARYKTAIDILQKLADEGDMSAAFWLEDAKTNLRNLIDDIKKE